MLLCGTIKLMLFSAETTFRLYCDKIGIPFEDRMLNWEENCPDLEVFKDWMPWFEGVLTTNTFQPSATKPKSPMMMPDLPRHVQKAIDDNMVYYNKMYALRLKSHTLQILWTGDALTQTLVLKYMDRTLHRGENTPAPSGKENEAYVQLKILWIK